MERHIQSNGKIKLAHLKLRLLRHLHTVAVRNIPLSHGTKLSSLYIYYSLHIDEDSPAFHVSEQVSASLNPTWSYVDLKKFDERVTTSSYCVLCLWSVNDNVKTVQIKWNIHLSGLCYIGNNLQSLKAEEQCALILGFQDGYFSTSPGVVVWYQNCVEQIPEEPSIVKQSYNVTSLERIQTGLRAIKQTKSSCRARLENITEVITKKKVINEKKLEIDELRIKISLLEKDVDSRTNSLLQSKESDEKLQSKNNQKGAYIRNQFDTLKRDKDKLEEKENNFIELRDEFRETKINLFKRRMHFIDELSHIYPITKNEESCYAICGVKLPYSEELPSKDEFMISVALSYCVHLLKMLSKFLDFRLQYTTEHFPSQAHIWDYVHLELTDNFRKFPLYGKNKEKKLFEYAVILLNRNIAQIRYLFNLGTKDLAPTLQNILSLFQYCSNSVLDKNVHFSTVISDKNIPKSLKDEHSTNSLKSKESILNQSINVSSNISSGVLTSSVSKIKDDSPNHLVACSNGDKSKTATRKTKDELGVIFTPLLQNSNKINPNSISENVNLKKRSKKKINKTSPNHSGLANSLLEVKVNDVDSAMAKLKEYQINEIDDEEPVFKHNVLEKKERTRHVKPDSSSYNNSKFKNWNKMNNTHSDLFSLEAETISDRNNVKSLRISDLYKTSSNPELESPEEIKDFNAEIDSSKTGYNLPKSVSDICDNSNNSQFDNKLRERTDALLQTRGSFCQSSNKL